MKMTFEIPDAILRRAKSEAAAQGVSLSQFVTQAVEEKLRSAAQEEKPWLKHFGRLKYLGKETRRINKFTEGAFEKIDREIWK